MTKRKDPKDLIGAGRPEKYTKKYADKIAPSVPAMFENGESIAEVCVALGCSRDSCYKKKDISLKFSDSVKHWEML